MAGGNGQDKYVSVYIALIQATDAPSDSFPDGESIPGLK